MHTRLLPLLALIATVAACSGAPTPQGTEEAPLSPAPFFAGDEANDAGFAVDVSFWETPLAQSQADCLWDSGVRHVVVGTQDALIAQQQLAMAVSRGMTVDAYVYLYWDRDIASQVEAAFAMTRGFPIGRMWLDIEENPEGLGPSALVSLIQQGVDACHADGTAGCGIYTGPGFWKSYVANSGAFTGVPLWYALYNKKRSLSDWTTEHFGGWTSPVAKQFQTGPLCGMGGADWDVMQVSAKPTVTVDRTPPPPATTTPAAPQGLYPQEGMALPIDYVKIMSGTVPGATSYQLGLERYNGTSWGTYYTWTTPNAYVKVSPPAKAALYRLRARAQNAYGWGPWSDYASFDYGTYTGPRPDDAPPPEPTQSNEPPPPPPPAGVPGALAPDGGVVITTSAVAMTCSSVAGATSYQFAIDDDAGSGWSSYYTYAAGVPARTFYPQIHGADYRFRVRAMVSGSWGDWSSYATFHVK